MTARTTPTIPPVDIPVVVEEVLAFAFVAVEFKEVNGEIIVEEVDGPVAVIVRTGVLDVEVVVALVVAMDEVCVCQHWFQPEYIPKERYWSSTKW